MSKTLFPEVPRQPRLYDWLYRKTDKDVEMYKTFARDHQEVLEVAVGTGRLAIPLAQSGIHVYGIDYSPDMLKRFDERIQKLPPDVANRLKYAEADMRAFDLGKQFSFVYLPFGSFVYLLTLEDQLACLASLRRHLAPGGRLVVDVPTWAEAEDEGWLTNSPNLTKVHQGVDPQTGKTTEMWSTFRFDASTQIMEQDRHYRSYDAEGYLDSEQVVLWRSRFFLTGEFRLLAAANRLKIEKEYGDFHFGPHQHHSEVAVFVMTAA